MTSVPGRRSLWDDTLPAELRHRAEPLPGDVDADVAIVGGGLTALWTAHALGRLDPGIRVVVLEAARLGHGASGRNGGWCSALLPMSLPRIAARHGRAAAARFQRAMHATVDEVGRTAAAEGIDCHFAKGGTLTLARSPLQAERLRAEMAERASFGFTDDEWLDRDAAVARCAATDVVGARWTPHCAALHPMRLVHGLARVVARQGARLHEDTTVERIEPGRVTTDRGVVRAEVVVRATEAFTARLPGARRELLPLYSMMVATEPLPDDVWARIGLDGRPTFHDGRHLIVYGQRTADGRLAFGGRGAPYHFGSAVRPEHDTDDTVRAALVDALHDLFPVVRGAAVTHHWGGPLGVSRDWQCAVRFDRRTGMATAGGYVGDGLATTNLAGRTLADLITGRDTDLVRLPWVGHRSRRWEPEPLRWIGVNVARHAAAASDRVEARTGRPSRWWSTVERVLLPH